MSTATGFYGIRFDTQMYGCPGLTLLASFAPANIRPRLYDRLPHLTTIHDRGTQPLLGQVGEYQWQLGVWSRPEPLVMCLFVVRRDRQPMTVQEGLTIERESLQQAERTAKRAITITPYDIRGDHILTRRIWANILTKRHWAHGIS